MVGGRFYILDSPGIHFVKIGQHIFERAVGGAGKGGNFLYTRVSRQTLQPAYLHQDPALDQAKFTEHFTQCSSFGQPRQQSLYELQTLDAI